MQITRVLGIFASAKFRYVHVLSTFEWMSSICMCFEWSWACFRECEIMLDHFLSVTRVYGWSLGFNVRWFHDVYNFFKHEIVRCIEFSGYTMKEVYELDFRCWFFLIICDNFELGNQFWAYLYGLCRFIYFQRLLIMLIKILNGS